MKLTTTSTVIRNIFNIHNQLTDSETLTFTPSSLDINLVDDAHVALLTQSIPSTYFKSYQSSDHQITINIPEFLSLIPKKSTPVTITIDNSITIKTPTQTLSIGYSPPTDPPSIPTLSPSNTIPLTTSTLTTFIKKASTITDHIAITTRPDGIHLTALYDSTTVHTHIPSAELPNATIDPSICLYSTDYLSILNHIKKIHSTMTLKFSTNEPLILTSSSPFPSTFLLAPRISHDDSIISDHQSIIDSTLPSTKTTLKSYY